MKKLDNSSTVFYLDACPDGIVQMEHLLLALNQQSDGVSMQIDITGVYIKSFPGKPNIKE